MVTLEHPRRARGDATLQDAASSLRLDACGLSEAGQVREHNEDRFLVDAVHGLAAVADGMGGHLAGGLASSRTLAALVESVGAPSDPGAGACANAQAHDPDATEVDLRLHSAVRLRRAVLHANTLLFQENRARGQADGKGMGSTLTGLQLLPALGAIVSFHVGDSRLYRLRDGVLVQLTRDHSAYQLALESGAAGELPPPNLLLQAIGPAPEIAPDVACHSVQANDLFLLCSDGLHGWVPHARIAQALAGATDLRDACAELLGLARRYASRDNVTALLARVAVDAPAKKIDGCASEAPGPA